MKKNNKSNRKSSRKSSSVNTQKLFRSGAHGFEALESRQMLDAALTNALLDSPIPYTEDASHQSTTFLTVTPTSDTASDGTSIFAGIRIYGMDSSGVRTTTEGYTISSIDKVDADGSKTPIPLLEPGEGIQGSYSFACAEMLLGQEYSITVSWIGDGEAPDFGAVAFLIGDTDSFDPATGLPALDPATGEYVANQQNNISDNEVKLIQAGILLDDPQTNWQHGAGDKLLEQSGFGEEYLGLFSLDTNGIWENKDLSRVEDNSEVGTVNFNITFDQESPALTVDVVNADGEFAGTATVTEGEKTGKVQDFTVDVKTSTDSPILNLNFEDAKSAIKSIKYSTDGKTYTDIPVSGDSKTENVTFDVADALGGVLTEGEPAVFFFQVADVIGNTGQYEFTVNYDSTADYNVGDDASVTQQGDGTTEGDVLYTNDSDGSSEVVVDPDFTFDEGDSTSQRVGIEYNGETYWSDYQTFDEENPTATLDLTQFDGLLDAMGAQDGVIPDGSYDLTVFVQDDYGHDPQQVGDPQTLVIDTTAPVIETVAVAGDPSGEVSIKDDASADVVVTLAQPDATNVRLTLDDKVETIPAGYTESDPIVIYRDVDYVYGKNELLVRATDKAGNTSAKTFIVWYNTTPEATAFTANGSEWGPGNKGVDEHGEPFDYSSEQYVALDFAGNVDDNNETPVENLVITVPQDAVVNGALYKKEANGPYVPLEPEEGVFTFKAADEIYYLPNRYWSGTETIPFTTTDDANTPATSESKNVVVTIAPVTTQTEVDWISPESVDENSLSSEQVIGTFAYPSSKPRTWTADWIPGNATAHILNDASDSIGGLFDTEPSFSVIEGDTVDGLTSFSIVMNDWVLSEYVWGSQDFIATLSGALVSDPSDVIGENSPSKTFTVTPVDQNPEAGTSKAFNVSLSTLSKQDVVITLDNTMFSDIDDQYDELTVASATLTSGENTLVIAQGESGVLEINGVETTFTLTDKTIVIASNDASALDKGLVEFEFTVTDNYGGIGDVAGSTIKFSAYTTDDDVATVQDAASYSFNVLQNDYDNSEGWDGKTFAISDFTDIDPAVGTLELIDANSITGNNFTFTPAAGWRGTVTFNYTIANQDDPSETADATVTIVVAALNTAPTADNLSSSGDEWGAENKDATTPQYVLVDFAIAIADDPEETAQNDLTIAFTGSGYADNGTWYQSTDGETFTEIADFSAIQLANGNVYFLPNNYWNGTVNVAYQVTDTVDNWVNPALVIADGETPLTDSGTVEIIIVSKATNPVVTDFANHEDEENSTLDSQTVNVAVAKLPEGAVNEAVNGMSAQSVNLEAHILNDESDSLDSLFDGEPSFAIDADGQITCTYKLLENVYGTQTFDVTVTTDCGGSTTFAWTITVDPLNQAPAITVNEDVFEEGTGDEEGMYLLKRELTEEAEPAQNQIVLGTVSDVDNVLATANITYYTVSGDGGHVWTLNNDEAQALFSEASFAVNGANELVFTYKLAPYVHGYADIVIQLNDLESAVDPTNQDSNSVTYRIIAASVNDVPVADDVNWSVSISSLLRSPSFDFNTVVSDIDNDAWTITALTLGETAIALDGTQTTVTVNGIDLTATYDPAAKTLTLDAPDGVDLTVLDKQSIDVAYTVNDNSPLGAMTADGTGTIAFTMYAQDDDESYNEQPEQTVHTIDVLANDKPIWEQEGKTFTLTEVSALSDPTAGSIEIVDQKVEFTQNADYRGTVTFTYTIVNDDDPTETATATVTILVKAINAAPTADEVDAEMAESQTGEDKVQLVFDAQVADRETADENLVVNVYKYDIENGVLTDADGEELPHNDGIYVFKATDAVYFKPNQYYNGEATIPYTVIDRLDDLIDAGYTLVEGETFKTATSDIIVVVTPVGTTPIVEVTDANTAEIASGAEQTTIAIGSASMPAGAESLSGITAQSKDFIAHITASDSLDSLLEEFAFNLDTTTGAITFSYTQIEHVWGSQTFELTVTTVEGGTKTVEWTFTVDPVNDAPEVQVAAKGMGAKETAIPVAFDVVDIETPTADLTYTLTAVPEYGTLYRDGEALAVGDTFTIGNGITYRVYDGAPEGITGDTFTYAVTDSGVDAGLTEADSITIENLTGVIEFNQAPVIVDYVGTKVVDTTPGAQTGSWLLFSLSDVVDPEGEPITKDNITLTGDAVWVGDSVYINYDFAQGKFGTKEALVTISDPVDASITSEYSFKLAAVASVGLHLSETRAATATNPLYVDFANNTVSSTDSPLDVATIIGEGPYTVTPNFSAGDDAQEMGTNSRPVYWQIPDGAAASSFWTTTPNEYPVYIDGVKQSGQYWDTAKAGLTSAEAPEDTTDFVTSYPKMVATPGTDANNPVIVTVTEDGKLTMQIVPYTPAIDMDGSVTISNGENRVTIPVAIFNGYESPTTFDLQYFVSTKAFTNTATVDRDGWFNEDQSQMDAQLLDSVDTQVTDSTGAALYWDPDCIGEDYWTTTPNEYPVYYGGNQQQDEETGLPLYWDTTKVSVDNNTTNVRPSSSRDRYPVMERSQASVAKKTSDIAYGADHYLNIFASDSWNQGNLRLNSVCTLAFRVNFGAPVTLMDTTSPASMGTNAADWNEDHSAVTFLMINLNTSAEGEGPGIVEDSYKMLLAAKYAYLSDFSSGTPTVTIELQAIQRNMESSVENLNTEQVIAGWADTCNPNPALYGTQGANQTVVEGTGVYMVVSTADEADSAAALPESESWISEWQSHYVDLYLNTQDADVDVAGNVSFTLNYGDLFTATDFIAMENVFDGGFQIDVENNAVQISGRLKDTVTAENGFVLLGRVKFESLGDDGLAANTVGTVDLGLSLDKIQLFNSAEEQIAVNTNVSVGTRAAAVVYDANDDGVIDASDFVSFATYYGTDTLASNDVLAWALDFNKSGSIDASDFVEFATNYGVSRANGKAVNFSEGFLKQYIGATIQGEGDADLAKLLNQAVGEWEAKLGIDLDVNIQIKVKNYEDTQLGESYIVSLADDGRPLTGVIVLDTDAAGLYWSINTDEVLEGKYDLYTVILHEVGHVLGFTDQYSAFTKVAKGSEFDGSHAADASDLMYETINPGERKEVSDFDANVVNSAYQYAQNNNVYLTFAGSAMTGTQSAETFQPEIASGIVEQAQWTKTLETKVYEELDRIVTANRDSVFAVVEDDAPILDDFSADEFAFDLAVKVESKDSLFDDLSWIDGDDAEPDQELDVELKPEF